MAFIRVKRAYDGADSLVNTTLIAVVKASEKGGATMFWVDDSSLDVLETLEEVEALLESAGEYLK